VRFFRAIAWRQAVDLECLRDGMIDLDDLAHPLEPWGERGAGPSWCQVVSLCP
jgi:hypothetical protein